MNQIDPQARCDLRNEVRRLTQEGVPTESLFDLACGISRTVLEYFPESTDEPEDLAMEFLLWLAKQGNLEVRTKHILTKLIKRHWQRRNSPASHELWKLVSRSLKELAASGVVRRLDAALETPNSNGARWTASSRERDVNPIDPIEFRAAARAVPFFPKDRKDYQRLLKGGKLLSPGDARELTLSLLKAAGGPIEMGDLVAEATRHVELPRIVDPSATMDGREGGDQEIAEGGGGSGDARDNSDSSPAAYTVQDEAQLIEEARNLARLLWEGVGTDRRRNGSEARLLLCGYVIPKYLNQTGVTLEQFGDCRRVKERIDELLADIAKLADVGEAKADPDQRWRLENLVMLALDIVGKQFCPAFQTGSGENPEKSKDSSFNVS